MSSHRFLFFSPSLELGDRTADLEGDEHHHLSRVLRAGTGREVFVTNGRGLMAQCRVERTRSRRTTLLVDAMDREDGGREVTLALALLKKENFAQALEQCVELGITECLPFVASKSHMSRYGPGTVARLQRVAVSAMKQSFRAWLPAVGGPVSFGEMLRRCAGRRTFVGAQDAPALRGAEAGPVTVVVGPEGGFTEAEVGALEGQGAVFASVSRHRLRAETAAALMVARVVQGD